MTTSASCSVRAERAAPAEYRLSDYIADESATSRSRALSEEMLSARDCCEERAYTYQYFPPRRRVCSGRGSAAHFGDLLLRITPKWSVDSHWRPPIAPTRRPILWLPSAPPKAEPFAPWRVTIKNLSRKRSRRSGSTTRTLAVTSSPRRERACFTRCASARARRAQLLRFRPRFGRKFRRNWRWLGVTPSGK